MTFASGWASGINAYATVVVLGLLGRFVHVADVPAGFQRTDVLIVMAVLAVLELVADKIPYVDSAWDTVSTIIRPVAGAVIGALIAGQQGNLPMLAFAAIGGTSALLSHLTKSSLRLAINTSPEPVTNVAASTAGDVGMVAIASLAALHPLVAATIAGVILLIGMVIAILVLHRIRRGWRAFRRWWRSRQRSAATD